MLLLFQVIFYFERAKWPWIEKLKSNECYLIFQYDSPIDCYSDDTLEEMKEERLVLQNPEATDRIVQKAPAPVNPLAAMQARKFDPTKSNVLGCL